MEYLDKGNDAKWKLFFNLQFRDLGGDISIKGNLHKHDLSAHFKVSDVFLHEILQAWSNIIYEYDISSKKQLLSQGLWLTSLIRVNNNKAISLRAGNIACVLFQSKSYARRPCVYNTTCAVSF